MRTYCHRHQRNVVRGEVVSQGARPVRSSIVPILERGEHFTLSIPIRMGAITCLVYYVSWAARYNLKSTRAKGSAKNSIMKKHVCVKCK